MKSTDWYSVNELTCVAMAEAASQGACMTGGEPTATGYTQLYNGTGTTLTPPVFIKYAGNTSEAMEKAICAMVEL